MTIAATKTAIKVADEVWISTALLHFENPERSDFTVKEIIERVERESLYGSLRPGVYPHAIRHCVANQPPAPGRYRMLFATGKSTRRLFRAGDPYHPDRHDAKIVPERKEIPSSYHRLVDWYWSDYARRGMDLKSDPILNLQGLGKEIWGNENPDDYVRRLREDWK